MLVLAKEPGALPGVRWALRVVGYWQQLLRRLGRRGLGPRRGGGEWALAMIQVDVALRHHVDGDALAD